MKQNCTVLIVLGFEWKERTNNGVEKLNGLTVDELRVWALGVFSMNTQVTSFFGAWRRLCFVLFFFSMFFFSNSLVNSKRVHTLLLTVVKLNKYNNALSYESRWQLKPNLSAILSWFSVTSLT